MKKSSRLTLLLLSICFFLLFISLRIWRLGDQTRIGMINVDLYLYYLPFLSYFKKTVLSGCWPLWNPYQGIGRPFFATMQCGFLYPFNWTIFLMDTPKALYAVQSLDVAAAMAGMMLFLRRWKVHVFPVIVAAILFGLAVLRESYALAIGSSYCWLPLILFSAQKLMDKPSFKRSTMVALFLSLSFLGGFPQYFVYNVLLLFFYVVAGLLLAEPRIRVRGLLIRATWLGAACAIVAGLVAIQLLPTYELSAYSIRTVGSEFAKSTFDLPPFSLSHFPVSILLMQYADRARADFLIGVALIFVPFAFVSRRFRVPVLSLTAVMGYPILFILSKQYPLISIFGDIPFTDSFRFPMRFLFYEQFPLAALVAIGVSTVCEKSPLKVKRADRSGFNWFTLIMSFWIAGILALSLKEFFLQKMESGACLVIITPAVIMLFALYILSSKMPFQKKMILFLFSEALILLIFVTHSRPLSMYWRYSFSAILILTIFFLLTRYPSGKLPERLLIVLISILIIADVTSQRKAYWDVPAFAPAQIPDVMAKGVKWGKNNKSEKGSFYRYFFLKDKNPNMASSTGCFSVDDYEPFTSNRWKNFVRFVVGESTFDDYNKDGWHIFYGEMTPFEKELMGQSRYLGLASVKYLFAQEGLTAANMSGFRQIPPAYKPGVLVYENEDALPRAYLVNDYVLANNEEESLSSIKEHLTELSNLVVLEEANPSFSARLAPGKAGSAKIIEYASDKVVIQVEARTESLLVLTDSYFPGWEAYVDGAKSPIWRANSLFRAVEISPGNHKVEFVYRPHSFYFGAIISSVTAVFVIAGLFIEKRFALKRQAAPERISDDMAIERPLSQISG